MVRFRLHFGHSVTVYASRRHCLLELDLWLEVLVEMNLPVKVTAANEMDVVWDSVWRAG